MSKIDFSPVKIFSALTLQERRELFGLKVLESALKRIEKIIKLAFGGNPKLEVRWYSSKFEHLEDEIKLYEQALNNLGWEETQSGSSFWVESPSERITIFSDSDYGKRKRSEQNEQE